MSTMTSDWRAAAAPSSVARSLPAAWAPATRSARPGSSATCARPPLTASTTAGFTSTAMTFHPWDANWAASGSPILPAPTTVTVPAVPGSPDHGVTDRTGP